MQTRTPWFPMKIKPVRKGWYEAKLRNMPPIIRLYWNGKEWNWGPFFHSIFPLLPGDKWRGLSAEHILH
jgi:hypothetical protein